MAGRQHSAWLSQGSLSRRRHTEPSSSARPATTSSLGRLRPTCRSAKAGNDSIRARGGPDEIHGQADGDRVKAGAGDDVSYGGGGPDNMWPAVAPTGSSAGRETTFSMPWQTTTRWTGSTAASGQDVAWLSQNERGLYRIDDCEILKIVVPSAEQLAEENED